MDRMNYFTPNERKRKAIILEKGLDINELVGRLDLVEKQNNVNKPLISESIDDLF